MSISLHVMKGKLCKDDMIRKGKDLEKVVLARAVHLYLEHRVLVYGNKTIIFE
jgi:formyltetrahydrofolate deformylase